MDKALYVSIDIQCRGFAQFAGDETSSPEEVVVDVLNDIIAQIQSGTKVTDMDGDALRVWTGQDVGAFFVIKDKASK